MTPQAAANRHARLNALDWSERLELIVETMREMSAHTDPQEMVRDYGRRMESLLRRERFVALSRRGLEPPTYRITRSNLFTREINPWREPHALPMFDSGLLGEMLYESRPVVIDDLQVPADDPAAEYLEGMRSLMALPVWDDGQVLNMTVLMSAEPGAFPREQLPEMVWMSGLFGRATQTLVLREQVKAAYDAVDRELARVADMQRSLLPPALPKIPSLDLAAHYQTARHAGGDYYDFFPLPEGRWGLIIADVSGHGVPAAVLMAITHSLAHTFSAGVAEPAPLLRYLNRQLHDRYTHDNGLFITAFYAVFDPRDRTLRYSAAGHNPPRLKRCADGGLFSLNEARSLPLGIDPETGYEEAEMDLAIGDQIILYTDGVTEAMNEGGDMFGVERLDQVLENCAIDADGLIHATLDALRVFTAGAPPADDRTLLVAKVT